MACHITAPPPPPHCLIPVSATGPGGLEGIIEAGPGGSGTTYKIVQGGGAKQKLVQGAFTSLSLGGRGIIQACPGVFL